MKFFCGILTLVLIFSVFSFLSPTVYGEDAPERVVLTPKILVESYTCTSLEEDTQAGNVKAGDRIQVKITLVNKSKTEAVQNMTVTATTEGNGLFLESISDTQYIEYFPANATIDVIYEYETRADMSAGQYSIGIHYDFAYGGGMTSAGSGTARITVTQPLKMELSVIQIPEKAVISDTVTVGIQAINLSHAKAYNVRAIIEADGFLPCGTAYIGDVEGGTAKEGSVQVTITGLIKGNFPYGQTKGTVTFYYEDADGNERTEVKQFTTMIESPFSTGANTVEDKPQQWWSIMAIIGGIILIFTTVIILRKIKECRKNEMVS